MTQVSGRQVIAAAAIVGTAVVLGSGVLALSLNRVTQQLERATARLGEIRAVVADAKEALSGLPVAAAPAARPRQADSSRRYQIDVAGAPALGPPTAPVTIAEFADFQ
jgi:protein-disulfide isomerase